MSMGERLRKLRQQRGLSAKDIAGKLGVAVTTYREWENGRKISGEPYVELSKIFHVSVAELLTGKGPQDSEIFGYISELENSLEKLKQALYSSL